MIPLGTAKKKGPHAFQILKYNTGPILFFVGKIMDLFLTARSSNDTLNLLSSPEVTQHSAERERAFYIDKISKIMKSLFTRRRRWFLAVSYLIVIGKLPIFHAAEPAAKIWPILHKWKMTAFVTLRNGYCMKIGLKLCQHRYLKRLMMRLHTGSRR